MSTIETEREICLRLTTTKAASIDVVLLLNINIFHTFSCVSNDDFELEFVSWDRYN